MTAPGPGHIPASYWADQIRADLKRRRDAELARADHPTTETETEEQP